MEQRASAGVGPRYDIEDHFVTYVHVLATGLVPFIREVRAMSHHVFHDGVGNARRLFLGRKLGYTHVNAIVFVAQLAHVHTIEPPIVPS